MAPRLIKLASTPKIFISDNANNKHIGITDATTSPDLKLPNRRTTTKITIKQPKIRFSAIVKVVLPINSLLSKKGFIRMPGGRAGEISFTLSFTALITSLELAPFSIITCPKTFSPSPLPVIAPKRVALPKPTVATSLIKTGVPFLFSITIFSMSSIEFASPSPLTK